MDTLLPAITTPAPNLADYSTEHQVALSACITHFQLGCESINRGVLGIARSILAVQSILHDRVAVTKFLTEHFKLSRRSAFRYLKAACVLQRIETLIPMEQVATLEGLSWTALLRVEQVPESALNAILESGTLELPNAEETQQEEEASEPTSSETILSLATLKAQSDQAARDLEAAKRLLTQANAENDHLRARGDADDIELTALREQIRQRTEQAANLTASQNKELQALNSRIKTGQQEMDAILVRTDLLKKGVAPDAELLKLIKVITDNVAQATTNWTKLTTSCPEDHPMRKRLAEAIQNALKPMLAASAEAEPSPSAKPGVTDA